MKKQIRQFIAVAAGLFITNLTMSQVVVNVAATTKAATKAASAAASVAAKASSATAAAVNKTSASVTSVTQTAGKAATQVGTGVITGTNAAQSTTVNVSPGAAAQSGTASNTNVVDVQTGSINISSSTDAQSTTALNTATTSNTANAAADNTTQKATEAKQEVKNDMQATVTGIKTISAGTSTSFASNANVQGSAGDKSHRASAQAAVKSGAVINAKGSTHTKAAKEKIAAASKAVKDDANDLKAKTIETTKKVSSTKIDANAKVNASGSAKTNVPQ